MIICFGARSRRAVWISFELGFDCQRSGSRLPGLLCGLARPLFLVLEEKNTVHVLGRQIIRVDHEGSGLMFVGEIAVTYWPQDVNVIYAYGPYTEYSTLWIPKVNYGTRVM